MIPVHRSASSAHGIMAPRSLLLAAGIVIVVGLFLLVTMNDEYSEEMDLVAQQQSASQNIGMFGTSPTSSATSGKLFTGKEIRIFDRKDLAKFATFHPDVHAAELQRANTHERDDIGKSCTHWSVVTTIFEPSEAVKKQALLGEGWCLCVVGDKKGPSAYDIPVYKKENYIFLTPAKQEELAAHYPLIDLLPWNHFARKNVGYLYAIAHGAQVIWDFDDDNMLINTMMDISSPEKFTAGFQVTVAEPQDYNSNQFNPYPHMGAPTKPAWPRGFPLDHIRDVDDGKVTVNLKQIKVSLTEIGVVQSLANHDPDMDAIYRLTQPLPFDFATQPTAKYVMVPSTGTAYSPYNAQATLHLRSALWSLLLPITVHGRVSDIWRGYMAQKVAKYLGLRFVFSYATVKQDRNAHNYLADFDSEQPLYMESSKLLEQLNEWDLTLHNNNKDSEKIVNVPGLIEEMWILMYEHGYIEIADVKQCQAWLQSLVAAGYDFNIDVHASTPAQTAAPPAAGKITSNNQTKPKNMPTAVPTKLSTVTASQTANSATSTTATVSIAPTKAPTVQTGAKLRH